YDEGGQLTEALRRNPYSVVLLDEIEKAHPDVFNILLQVFDDGRITDSKGRTVNCRNALFIMTSNLGSDLLLKRLQESKDADWNKEALLDLLRPTLQGHFRPEFLNRLDEILPFLPLHAKDMAAIVEIQLKHVAQRLADKRVTLKWNTDVVGYLSEKGYDPAFGARPLKRLIQHEVVNMLANGVLSGKIQPDTTLTLRLQDGSIAF
ncbi:MAG: AAA family ATPase, partial [Chlamydiia bacterium]|nr:AAA family ATPase [Chlamydiia bacterium]